jgi:hypothetical protein
VRRRIPGISIVRGAGDAPTRVNGRLRIGRGAAFDATVDVHANALADEEVLEAALLRLRERHPGARWADPHAAALTAAVTGDRPLARWLFRLPMYLLLWMLAIAPVTYGVEHLFRERVIVPACMDWGRSRNVQFVSYSKGGGAWHDVFNLSGSYSAAGCYFAGGAPNFATLREIGGTRLSWTGALGGAGAVALGVVSTTVLVILVALGVEAVLRLRAGR